MSFIRNDLFEVLDPDFTKRLHEKYNYCVVAYVRLRLKADYEGKASHRAAALHGMEEIILHMKKYFEELDKRLQEDFKDDPAYKEHDYSFDENIDEAKLIGSSYPLELFFARSNDVLSEPRFAHNQNKYRINPDYIYHLYVDAFCQPPYFSNISHIKDWDDVNSELFPCREKLEIYSWNDNWYDYFFGSGKEWWGCFYWTVYDRETKIFTIVAASTTD